MKRVICILLLLVILTGCKASYDLEIDDIFFNESVNSSFNYKELELEEKDSLSSFEVSDINAFYKDSDDIFNKNITYDDNKVNINIDYDYTAYNFDNAYLINTCFDGHVFVSDDKYYYIELMGDFSCQYASSIDINIITNYIVLDTNAVKKGNKYTWTLTDNNNSDVNMYIKIDKYNVNNDLNSNSWMKVIKIIGFVILIILSIIAYLLYKKKNSDEI